MSYTSVMTKGSRCEWCRGIIAQGGTIGRPRRYCSQRCRQWAWVARQRADELELSESELVVARSSLDDLHDQLYMLRCAIDDAQRDFADAGTRITKSELIDILTTLTEAATPVANASLTPATS
jgi:hypothetical protein